MFAIIRNTAVGAPKTLIALGVFLFLFMPLLSLSQETKYEQRYSRGNDPAAYAENSVLSSGKWIKIAVSETGVYQIGYDELAAMGFNVQSLDPRNLSLFGNGGAMLPEGNFEPRYDDLVENAVFVEGETDGVMNQGDALFFYGQEPGFWKYQNNRFIFQKNLFSDSTFYFLTVLDRPGKRVEVLAQAQGEPGRETAIFLDYRQHESDLENLIMSGKEWFGEELSKAHPSETFTFNFANRETTRPLRFEMNLAGRSITESFQFDVKANGQTIVNPIVIQQLSSGNSTHARDFTQNISFSSNADDLSFEITIDAQSDNSKAWLNYIRINSWCKLNYNSAKQLQFRNPEVVYENAVAKFLLSGNMTQARLWDVTHSLAPKSQQFEVNGEQMHFKANADSIRQYVLFEKSNTLSIGSYSSVKNQNLHAIKNADMLIVAHPDFIDEAHALASVHYNDDGLNSVVVDINEIYNEFGSGQQDVTAIRDFVRMVYAKSEGQLSNLLLFGDGSYDYKNRIANNTNFVPTYQASVSLVETQSFVSDDYFGLLDHNEGADMFGILDIGIGRFPVSNKTDAQAMVNKVEQYLADSYEKSGEWRNNITFLADDADNNLHFDQAETLSGEVDTTNENLNIQKIYLDSFKRIVVPGGYRYPDANKAILAKINEGSLIVNYTGHGGITGLSEEKALTIGEIENLNNIHKLPFFITATCEFSRFDNPGFVSAGERLLLNPNGGAIALMTTTRLAFAHSNFAVNRRVYESMFEENKQQMRRLGDIIRLSKNPTSTYIYNFVLLGDPALRLSYPRYKIEITEINALDPAESDTLGALSELRVKGKITGVNGQTMNDFNGFVYPKFFDKKSRFKTLANDGASVAANFSYFSKLIYRGKASVKNGLFEFNFIIPKDIAYQFGKTKLSLYAFDTIQNTDAGGYFNDLVVGGFDENAEADTKGPDIEMYLNEPDFQSGDYSSPNPIVYAKLYDPQGIHFLGQSIGRDITLTLSGPQEGHFYLNEYYQPALDAFDKGTLTFQLHNLPDGNYKLTVKAWDLHNNSSEKEIQFVIDTDARLQITSLKNSPNPFSGSTNIYFQHNQPNKTLGVTVDIFNQFGAHIKSMTKDLMSSGTSSLPFEWDGTNQTGYRAPAGLYVYQVSITNEAGDRFTAGQKLILLPVKE